MSAQLHQYAREAAEKHGLTKAVVLGQDRNKTAYAARCEVIQRLRGDGHSISHIGWLVGRHHTTVMHALGLI